MDALFTFENLIALLTLTVLEIVLGIDNIVILAILAGRLEHDVQHRARQLGLTLAMVMRIALLLTLSWFIGLTEPLFELFGQPFSLRDLILIAGGVFLLVKATSELREKVVGEQKKGKSRRASAVFGLVILQIIAMDMVFSLDSVLTAIGMAQHVEVMAVAIVIAVMIMMVFAGVVARFVHRHPTIKVLALAFVLLIGVMLVADGFGKHIERGYIYFALGFSLFTEMINLRVRSQAEHPA